MDLFFHNKESIKRKFVQYHCLACECEEDIPLDVVKDMGRMDGGDPAVASQFRCSACGGAMYPEYYKGVHGYEYRLADVQEPKND